MKTTIFSMLSSLAILIPQISFAISQDEAVGIATSYKKTVNKKAGLFGPVPSPELPAQAKLARVRLFTNAQPEPAYLIVFGVTFNSNYDDGCSLVTLISANTGKILPAASLPGLTPYPEDNGQKTSVLWRCWQGDEHPNG
jgi:hypothetical protein